MATETIAEKLKSKHIALTRAERQLCNIILKNYPASGLGTITTLAKSASVSMPTVARLVQKLGFNGYQEFQRSLHDELGEKISSPLTKREKWVDTAPKEHILNRFTKTVIENIGQSMANIEPSEFEKACSLLGDAERKIFIVGGRITRTLSDYFFLHLQVIRQNVVHIASNSNAWPHYILDLNKDDIVVIFDIRRYENSSLKLAELTKERGANIILFTDQWISPIAQYASVCFKNQIEVPSAWDSNITTMLMLEITLAEVQERNWSKTCTRMEALEEMFDRTKFFRKL